MKKILLVHNKYRETGGEDIAVENELNFLKKYHTVELLYFDNNIESFLKQFFHFLVNSNLNSKQRLIQKIDSFNPDIVYVHNTWFKASTAIFDVLKKRNIKTVIKLHNYRFHCTKSLKIKSHISNKGFCQACGIEKKKFMYLNKYFSDSYLKSFLVYFYNKKFLKVLKDEFFTIVTLTNYQLNFLVQNNYRENIKLKKLVNIFDLEVNVDSNTNTRNNLVYAGRISKEKGVEELITSFKNSKLDNFTLKIIGTGPDMNYLQKQYSNKNIEFLGFLPNQKVKEVINKSTAVVSATKLLEGQPTLIYEACALKKPVIFPKSGGIPEYLSKENPFLFEPLDYWDLTNKLNMLLDTKLVLEVVENNYLHTLDIFDRDNYLRLFSELADD